MEDVDEICYTKLGLGIGSDDYEAKRDQQKMKHKANKCLDLSFPLHQKFDGGVCGDNGKKSEGSSSKASTSKEKKEEEDKQSHCISNDSQEDHNNIGVIRKKLRLTTEQSTILENSFRQQTTLNTAEKQALAQRLSLKPRQVEVWFQNRRARTKLKQTEVDCEYLKKRCENLNEENRRLKKELQELRLSKMEKSSNPPFCVQLQNAAKKIAMCPYCENVGRASLVKMNAATEVKLETITRVVATTATVAGVVVNDKPSNNCHMQQGGRGFNLNISEFERELQWLDIIFRKEKNC